jgi:hypothetical protein
MQGEDVTGPQRPIQKIQPGDEVAFCESYLERIGQDYPNVKRARGKVTALISVHQELVLADIEWDKPYLPKRVDVRNLTRVPNIPRGK